MADATAPSRGFTLIEVMVVVVILGLLAALIVPSLESSADRAKETRALTDVKVIAGAVRLYYTEHGKLPSLTELTTPDAKDHVYLDELPLDPWQNEYVLREGSTARQFEVISPGADRQLGSDDDITSRPTR